MILEPAQIALASFEQDAILIRRAAGVWNAVTGLYEIGPMERVAIKAVIQNSTQDDIRIQPEGERSDGWVTVWTRSVKLVGADENTGTVGDIIETPEGLTYRVSRAGLRNEASFSRAACRRVTDWGRGQ